MEANWQAYYEHRHERGEARAQAMYELYQQGMTYLEIGRKYGLSESAVSKAIIKWVLRTR